MPILKTSAPARKPAGRIVVSKPPGKASKTKATDTKTIKTTSAKIARTKAATAEADQGDESVAAPVKSAAPKKVARKTAAKKPVAKTAARKTAAGRTVAAKTIAEPAVADDAAVAAPQDPPRRRGPSGSRRSAVDRLDDPPPESGLPLIDRVQRAIEAEISQIETVIGANRVPVKLRSEAERRARTLAHLTRTLSELRRLRADQEPKRRDDDAIPRDLDELRRALSRRLDQLVAAAARVPAGGDE